MNNALLAKYTGNNKIIFVLIWVLTFIMYIPTVKAGWVIDAVGWIYNMKHLSFWEYINTTHASVQNLYQLYALDYLIFYKLWGLNVWAWGLSFITVHAVNAFLLYVICKTIFTDSEVKNASAIALCGSIVFTVCPHISEVLIWKACFHYLQGFLFILLIMYWVQRYQKEQKSKYIIGSIVIYALSAFALEIFYLTPWFVLTIALYYRLALGYDKAIFKKTILYFFAPLLSVFGGYLLLLHARYGGFTPHVNNVFSQTIPEYLSKPPKYLFHLVTLGRYFSYEAKEKVSAFFGSTVVLIVFYSIVFLALLDAVTRFPKMNNSRRAVLLLAIWVLMTIAFLMPLPFPGTNLLVFYDRYTYFASGFIYTLLAVVIAQYVNKYVAAAIFVAYVGINIFFTLKVNRYWKHSAYITKRLMHDLPDAGDKIILLLNLPENMNGVPMMGAQQEGQYKLMCEIIDGKTIKNPIYDVASYNMLDDRNGAHVIISNDSMIHVTLNQWKTWWWYGGHGAKSYENADYKVNMIDPGHWYELTLKKPASQYLMLYEAGDQWKVVDMKKRNEDQY